MTRDPLASLSGHLPARPARAAQTGEITEVLGPGLFRVDLPGSVQVVAHLAGAMRMLTPRLIPGDRVEVEVSSHDPSRGRIVRRRGGG